MATQPNWWDEAPLLAPANDPGFTGYMPGVPKPKDPKPPVFVPQGATQMMLPDGTFAPVPGAPNEKDAIKQAIDSLGVDELLLNIQRGRKNLESGWATGLKGKIADMAPGGGTPRQDFLGALEGLQGGVIMEKLQLLKDLSKTGASGMGALSEREGQRMAAAVASLREDMSEQEYETTFKIIERHAKALQAIRDGLDPRDPKVAEKYSIPALADIQADIQGEKPEVPPADDMAGAPRLTSAASAGPPGAGGGEAASVGVHELTADQKTAYSNFWKQNPDPKPEELKNFLSSIGISGVANADEIIKAQKEGRGFSAVRVDTDYRSKVEQTVKQDRELGNEENASSLLFKQGAMLDLGDEASGVGNALANAITSPFTAESFDPLTAYSVGRDAERMRIANAREQLGYGGTALEFAGAVASGRPTSALGVLTRPQAARAAGTAGAVGGALSGFGAGEGSVESAAGAGIGALAGYGLGRYGGDVIERALPRRFRSPRGMAPELADAAEAEGVDLIRPMVDPRSRAKFGALESNPTAQPIIREGVENTRGQIEEGVERLGQGGAALEPGAAGERLQTASNRYIQRTKGVKDRLYNRAENLAGDARFVPQKAIEQVDEEIAALAGNEGANAAEIGFLQTIRNDLAKPGGKTVSEIRNLRESLRGEISRTNLTFSGAEARALRAMSAAADDIAENVPQAASAYKRADAFYRERQVMVDDIKKAILGKPADPMDPQKAFQNIKSLASPGGNGRRLAAVMRNLEPGERQDIAATVAQALGRDAPDMPFSPAKFISQTSKLSPSARRTIFGPDGAESIQNLRTIAQAFKEAGGDINYSRSTTVANRMSPIKTAARGFVASLTGLGGYAAADVGGAIAGAAIATGAMAGSGAVKALSARAMVNPRVTRWLAQAVDVSTPAQAKDATRKLGVIIGREPALARELQPIHDFLTQRLTQPLAAESGEQNEQ